MKATKANIKKFKSTFKLGMESIHEACQMYVAMIDSDRQAIEKIQSECSEFPTSIWTELERIGRGTLDHRLLWAGGASQSYLKRVPISDQRRALDQGVEVLNSDGSHLVVKPENLTVQQRKQVFNGTSVTTVRTIPAQRAWIESQKPSKPLPCFAWIDGKLHVYKPCILTAEEVCNG